MTTAMPSNNTTKELSVDDLLRELNAERQLTTELRTRAVLAEEHSRQADAQLQLLAQANTRLWDLTTMQSQTIQAMAMAQAQTQAQRAGVARPGSVVGPGATLPLADHAQSKALELMEQAMTVAPRSAQSQTLKPAGPVRLGAGAFAHAFANAMNRAQAEDAMRQAQIDSFITDEPGESKT